MQKYAWTTGANLIQPSDKPRRFQLPGVGRDNRGEPRYNEFQLDGLVPTKSNDVFTVVTATHLSTSQKVEVRLHHKTNYLTEV